MKNEKITLNRSAREIRRSGKNANHSFWLWITFLSDPCIKSNISPYGDRETRKKWQIWGVGCSTPLSNFYTNFGMWVANQCLYFIIVRLKKEVVCLKTCERLENQRGKSLLFFFNRQQKFRFESVISFVQCEIWNVIAGWKIVAQVLIKFVMQCKVFYSVCHIFCPLVMYEKKKGNKVCSLR